MNYLIKIVSIFILVFLPFLADGNKYSSGLSSIENRIKIAASKFNIEKIEIASFATKNTVKVSVVYREKKKEIIFTEDELEKANNGYFSPSTVKKINEIFESKNNLCLFRLNICFPNFLSDVESSVSSKNESMYSPFSYKGEFISSPAVLNMIPPVEKQKSAPLNKPNATSVQPPGGGPVQ